MPSPNVPSDPPPNPCDKSEFVKTGFSDIAAVYDRYNDLITFGMHRHWKNMVAKAILDTSPKNILDACCGTGDIALRTAYRATKKGAEPNITGLDFSKTMLDVAIQRNQFPRNIKYIHGDVQKSGFSNETFDAVSIGFGLRNVTNIPHCLAEFYRILRPDGALVILDMGKITAPFIQPLYNAYFFGVVPFIGKRFLKNSEIFGYFPQSTIHYPDSRALGSLLEKQGFSNVGVKRFAFGGVTLHIAKKHPYPGKKSTVGATK